MRPATQRERFELLYQELYEPISGYVLRRSESTEDAAEAIAETFVVLWRRLDACPNGEEARPWLFGVARRVLSNQRRGERRRTALAERLIGELDPTDVSLPAGSDSRVARAFAALSESDREVLALVAWEGLTREELAVALGVSRPVARLRLHRARRRFEAALAAPRPTAAFRRENTMSATDPTELIARLAPISDADAAEVFGAGKDRLLDAITQLPRGRSRRLPRRPLAIVFAALVVAAATGAGWAALSPAPARETTAIDCAIDGRLGTVIDATSGDPAADCAAIWPAPVPKLQAYDDGIGGIAVLPASEKAPAGWTPIESQDVALIVLQERLDDKINGLDSACFGSSQATTFAQQQLDQLGLAGWSVATRSGAGPCYAGLADAQAKTVTLLPMGDPSGAANWPPEQLADSLRPLTQQCLSLAAMKSEVVQRATALGMSQAFESDGYVLKAFEDDTLRCATVTEAVTGETYVVVRGPAH